MRPYHLDLIRAIGQGVDQTQNLGHHLHQTQQSIGKAVTTLIWLKLVRRVIAAEDRRARKITLTAKGRKAWDILKTVLKENGAANQ